MPTSPHEHRRIAQSFGTDAARYDRSRPAYPAELIDRIARESPGPRVVDVGCGTGIVARQLRSAGCRVLGVEPDERMAAFARGTGIDVETATIERWDRAGRVFDALVAGQTWHWVDPAAGARAAAAALVPGGLLALFWHVYQAPQPIQDAVTAAYARVVPDSPIEVRGAGGDPYRTILEPAAAGLDAAGFTAREEWTFETSLTCTTATYTELMLTSGAATHLPPATARTLAAELTAALDARGGTFTMPLRTVALTARR